MVKGAYFSEGFDVLETKIKNRKKVVFFSMELVSGQGTIFTLRYPSENNQCDKW